MSISTMFQVQELSPSSVQQEMVTQYTEQLYSFGAIDVSTDNELNRLSAQANVLSEEVDKIIQERMQIINKVHEYGVYFKQARMAPNGLNEYKSDLESRRVSFFNDATCNREKSLRCLQSINKVLEDMGQLQYNIVTNKLSIWKREQQLANNGCTFISPDTCIERIQKLSSSLSDVLIQLRKILYKFKCEFTILSKILKEEKTLTYLEESITKSITAVEEQIRDLVKSTFVIEKQPPQVMKTNTKVAATVTLLTGNKFNPEAPLPTVHAYLINSLEASEFLENPRQPNLEPSRKRPAKGDAGANEIINSSVPLEINFLNGQVVANFKNMQLKRIRRTEKKGAESVMEEKFAILFTASMKVLNGYPDVFLWTMSLPVVVIVHGNQEPHAWATITWDNAFAELSRKLFNVAQAVPWPDLAQVLMTKFEMYTKRRLSDQDLHFLGTKVLRRQITYEELKQEMVPWNLFARENLSEGSSSFTFWEWFFAVLKVSKEHLKHFFAERMIVSFLTRQQAKDMLLQADELLEAGLLPGTFLLRFSDSELGGVTIAWLKNENGVKEIVHVQPFTSRDLAVRSLADRICDLKELTNFFPDTPKDHVFGRHYTPTQAERKNGYVTPILALTLPNSVNRCQNHHEKLIHSVSKSMVSDARPPSDSMTTDKGYISENSVESSSVSSTVSDYIDYKASNGIWNQIPIDFNVADEVWNQMPATEMDNQFQMTFPVYP